MSIPWRIGDIQLAVIDEWGESKQMREFGVCEGLVSGADVGREVLAGEGGAGGDEVGGCAFEDDPAAVAAGAGAEVDDPVGVCRDRLVVPDDDDRLARAGRAGRAAARPAPGSDHGCQQRAAQAAADPSR
jgi:hypothetical protein